jgi:hypothetical protein
VFIYTFVSGESTPYFECLCTFHAVCTSLSVIVVIFRILKQAILCSFVSVLIDHLYFPFDNVCFDTLLLNNQ